MENFKSFMSPGSDPFANSPLNGQTFTDLKNTASEKFKSVSTDIGNKFTTGLPEQTSTLVKQGASFKDLSGAKPFSAGNYSANFGHAINENSFPHKANNIVTSTTPLKLNTQFQPNILDEYDAYTYHWKLFITTPEASSNGLVMNTKFQTIIAESGVSDLTIDKVEIRSITTPSVECGTGTSTNVKFEIVEPSGAGLIDKIFYQSLSLGIGNWNVMPVYLQLQFKARSPVDSEAYNGEPGPINGMRWVWALKLTSIKANVTTVGTRYEFEAIIYNELAQSNAYFTMQHAIVLNDLDRFDAAMAQLQDKLNQDQIYKLIDNYSIPDTYIIITDQEVGRCNIKPPNNNENSARSNSTNTFDGKNASFAAGTSIDKIIDSLLAQTAKYQIGMLNARVAGEEGQPLDAEVSQMKKFWRIITESRPIKYDPRRNDYAREFTIYVIEYDMGVLDANTFQDTAPPNTIAQERKRLVTYLDKAILKKKYNYMYTGLNDQIINFDIKLNNAFASAVSRMGGVYFNAAMADKSIVNQTNSAEEAAATEKIQRAMSMKNTASTLRQADNAIDALNEASAAAKAAHLTKDQIEFNKMLLDKQKPADMLAYLRKIQTAGGLLNNKTLSTSTIGEAQKNARSLATPVENTNLSFISDININSAQAKTAYTNFAESVKGKLRPVARIDSMHQAQIGMGVESSSNSGIQKLSSMFAVALHSNLDGSFAQISLTIKGDPFWLFPQPVVGIDKNIYNSLKPNQSEAIEWIKNAHSKMAPYSVNIFGADSFIIIRFRTPRVFDIDENPDTTTPFTEVETFSGVFKVTSVTSKFEAGKFKQDLNCYLDPLINIVNFYDQIEEDAGKPAAAATATANTASQNQTVKNTSIPATASKLNKLKSKIARKSLGLSQSATSVKEQIGATIDGIGIPKIGISYSSNIPQPFPSPLNGLPNKF